MEDWQKLMNGLNKHLEGSGWSFTLDKEDYSRKDIIIYGKKDVAILSFDIEDFNLDMVIRVTKNGLDLLIGVDVLNTALRKYKIDQV